MTKNALFKAESVHMSTKNLANTVLAAQERICHAISYLKWAYKDFVEFMDVLDADRRRLTDKRFVFEAKQFTWKWDEKLAQKLKDMNE